MNIDEKRKKITDQWIQKAANDLKNAEHTLKLDKECPFDTICFHAQQCVEKLLKAVLTFHGIAFPKSHDLTELRVLLPKPAQNEIDASELAEINPYAIETRYPGEYEVPSREEAEKAVQIARSIQNKIKKIFQLDAGLDKEENNKDAVKR